jgi:hypothetical protein
MFALQSLYARHLIGGNYPFSLGGEFGGLLIKMADRLDLLVFVGIFLRG